MKNIEHPLYGRKLIRAIFDPKDIDGLNDAANTMVGHEFVWEFVGMLGKEGVYTLSDFEDFAAYWEAVPDEFENMWKGFWILEKDLKIVRVENPDG